MSQLPFRQIRHADRPELSERFCIMSITINELDEVKRRICERVLSLERFTGLKAILENLSRSRENICDALSHANSFQDLLAKLGYPLTLTKQIHVQDAYSRLAPAGGVKTVLPYNDIPTHSSFPTLVNINSTVTATADSAAFFNKLLTALQEQCVAENQKHNGLNR